MTVLVTFDFQSSSFDCEGGNCSLDPSVWNNNYNETDSEIETENNEDMEISWKY